MPKTAKKQARSPRKEPTQRSRPVIIQEIKLESEPTQRVFARCYARTGESFFLLGVVLQKIASKEQIAEVEEIIDGHLNQLAEETQREKARLEKLIADCGITEQVFFTEPKTEKVEISSPRAHRLLARIQELDELVAELTKLWIGGELSDTQYSNAIYQQQQRIIRKTGKIQGITKRAMAAANRKRQDEQKAGETVAKPDEVKDPVNEELAPETTPTAVEEMPEPIAVAS